MDALHQSTDRSALPATGNADDRTSRCPRGYALDLIATAHARNAILKVRRHEEGIALEPAPLSPVALGIRDYMIETEASIVVCDERYVFTLGPEMGHPVDPEAIIDLLCAGVLTTSQRPGEPFPVFRLSAEVSATARIKTGARLKIADQRKLRYIRARHHRGAAWLEETVGKAARDVLAKMRKGARLCFDGVGYTIDGDVVSQRCFADLLSIGAIGLMNGRRSQGQIRYRNVAMRQEAMPPLPVLLGSVPR